MAQIDVSQVLPVTWTTEVPGIEIMQVLAVIWETPPQDTRTITLVPGALDIRFTLPEVLGALDFIRVITNIVVDDLTEDTGCYVQITRNSTYLDLHVVSSEGHYLQSYQMQEIDRQAADHRFRIYFHGNHISVYVDDYWAHTFSFIEAVYPIDPTVDFFVNDEITVTDILIAELHDYRTGIFTETESSGLDAIRAIIQERPIEIYFDSNGLPRFHYNAEPTPIDLTNAMVRKHTRTNQINNSAASDFILYYADVATVVDTEFLASDGFLTRMMRLSNLDNGADRFALIIARRMREKQEMSELTTRPDFRVEAGDVISISYTESGLGTVYADDLFVEQVRLELSAGHAAMMLLCRVHDA